MGRIQDKRKMRKKGRRRAKRWCYRRAQSVCAKHMRKGEGKSEESEDITRGEVYRDFWRVSIDSEYRKTLDDYRGVTAIVISIRLKN